MSRGARRVVDAHSLAKTLDARLVIGRQLRCLAKPLSAADQLLTSDSHRTSYGAHKPHPDGREAEDLCSPRIEERSAPHATRGSSSLFSRPNGPVRRFSGSPNALSSTPPPSRGRGRRDQPGR